jgi:hypothetical protein
MKRKKGSHEVRKKEIIKKSIKSKHSSTQVRNRMKELIKDVESKTKRKRKKEKARKSR